MSSLLKSTFCHLRLALLGVVVSSSLEAAVEPVQLKQDGNPVTVMGRKSCTESENVEIILGPEALKGGIGDFRATFAPVKKEVDAAKTKGDSLCSATLAAGATNPKSFTKTLNHVPAREFLTESACQPGGVSEKRIVCIYEGGGGTALVGFATYGVETAVAKIESIGEKIATNGEISFEVKITGGSGPFKIETCYGKANDGDIDADKKTCPAPFQLHSSPSEKVRISGLEDNVEYVFKVRLHEMKEEPTDFEPSFRETSIPVANPFSYYNGRGGELGFTCQQSGPSSLLLLALTLTTLAILRRREKWRRGKSPHALLLFGVVTLFLPETSHADFGQMNIGILGAMYRPDLDNEILPNGSKIFPFYKCFFRRKTSDQNGPINPLMGAEVDWHLWDGFGSLQFGFGFGYTFVTGHAVKLDSTGQPDCDNPIAKAKSTLHMYQIRPQLTYLFDHFAETVPFVPYIRGALIGHGYIFRLHDKAAPIVQNEGVMVKPNGFRFGYQAAVGMMLMLDFLEPGSVRSARGQGMLNHVYLKGELSLTKIDSFGRRGFQFSAKDVMGTNWPLMWTFGLVFELP